MLISASFVLQYSLLTWIDLKAQDEVEYSYSTPLLEIVNFLGGMSSGSSFGVYDEVAEEVDLRSSVVSGLTSTIPQKRRQSIY